MQDLQKPVGRVLITEGQIARRVEELAGRIASDYHGEPLTLAAVMTGSLIFVADLIRHLPLMMKIHITQMSSYPGAATRSQGVQTVSTRPENLTGRNVLIVDDILDSGRTLAAAAAQFRRSGAETVRTCVLVRKPASQRAGDGLADADYVGFDIPNEFVVGYGLDFNDYYRNLPYIAVLAELC